MAEFCARQLRGWADSLQNSDIRGQRHLNQKSRQDSEQARRAEAFRKELLRRLPEWHPMRKEAQEKGLI